MADIVKKEGLAAYKPELGTRPRVLYKNLHLWQNVFMAASVAFRDTDECAEGALFTVFQGDIKVGEGLTNNYGEVIVDGLDPDAETEIVVTASGYQSIKKVIHLDQSLNIGLVLLEKA